MTKNTKPKLYVVPSELYLVRMSRRFSCYVVMCLISACTVFCAQPARATNNIFAVLNPLSTNLFQEMVSIETNGVLCESNTIFGIMGGMYGGTFLDGTFYAIELENFTFDDYLVAIPHVANPFIIRTRIGTGPTAFTNVESLAACDGTLYATAFDFPSHITTLFTINTNTGIGTAVGQGSFDAYIVGMAYDPLNQVLYGAGKPFGASDAMLYRINKNTGDTTPVGNLGVTLESLTWHEELGLIGAFDSLYRVNPQTGLATALGTADYTHNNPGSFNGIYALGALLPDVLPSPVITSISILTNDVALTWTSVSGTDYGVQTSPVSPVPGWGLIPGSTQTAGAPTTTYTHVNGAIFTQLFYRVTTIEP